MWLRGQEGNRAAALFSPPFFQVLYICLTTGNLSTMRLWTLRTVSLPT